MYKIISADKDTYITNRVIKNNRVEHANVGAAATLDLFKLYGYTSSGSYPNIELSRLFVHFNLNPLRTLISQNKLDISNPSFNCSLILKDVYGGQTTPRNFTLTVNPLSKSFDEGIGRDIVLYSDNDVCNFLTSSKTQGTWYLSGCALGGGLPGSVDYITASTNAPNISFTSTQFFTTGEEDLNVDVTNIISATLAGILPDEGFRISFDNTHEIDTSTYFVKRFSGRTAYDESKRPSLCVKFDDSLQDDTQCLNFDSNCTLFLRNYSRGVLTNLMSSSSELTGSNCLLLKLITEISGGHYTLSFSGSQHSLGIFSQTGLYSSSVFISSNDSVIKNKLLLSNSISFIPVWSSIDETITYLSGTTLSIFPPTRSSQLLNKKFVVTVHNIQNELLNDKQYTARLNIFDSTSPTIIAQRLPKELPGIVVRDAHFRIRDSVTNDIIIPFDTVYNSTRISSDSIGMYFTIDTTNLRINRTYVIDIMIITNSTNDVYIDASPTFKIKT